MAKKRHAYLAVYVGEKLDRDHAKLSLWECMEYDQCFPLTDHRHPDWLVFARPFRTGDHRTEFTIGKWESFGYRYRKLDSIDSIVLGWSGGNISLAIPFEMSQEMQGLGAAHQTLRERRLTERSIA